MTKDYQKKASSNLVLEFFHNFVAIYYILGDMLGI